MGGVPASVVGVGGGGGGGRRGGGADGEGQVQCGEDDEALPRGEGAQVLRGAAAQAPKGQNDAGLAEDKRNPCGQDG